VEKNDTLGNRRQVVTLGSCLDCETISNETRHKCPKCAGGPWVSLSTFMDRESEPAPCALGAHVTAVPMSIQEALKQKLTQSQSAIKAFLDSAPKG
jgi:hypothetical protein